MASLLGDDAEGQNVATWTGALHGRGWAMRRGRRERVAGRRQRDRSCEGGGGPGRAAFARSVGKCGSGQTRRRHWCAWDCHGVTRKPSRANREYDGWTCVDVETQWWEIADQDEEEEEETAEMDMEMEMAMEEEKEMEELRGQLQQEVVPVKMRPEVEAHLADDRQRAHRDVELCSLEHHAGSSTCCSADDQSLEEEEEEVEDKEPSTTELSPPSVAAAANFRRRRALRWEEAMAMAERAALAWLSDCRDTPQPELGKGKGKGRREEKPLPPFEAFRAEFLRRHGSALVEDLERCWGPRGVTLHPAAVAPDLASRFLLLRGEHEAVPVFHGTAARNIPSILQIGLLVPGRQNEVKVLNGSAHGVGVYTAMIGNVGTSNGYCSERRMLVCAVLGEEVALPPSPTHEDPEGRTVTRHGQVLVIFDSRRVLPLFEATGCGLQATARGLQPVSRAPPATNPPPAQRRSGKEKQQRRAAETTLSDTAAFLLRRGARKRRPRVLAGWQGSRRW